MSECKDRKKGRKFVLVKDGAKLYSMSRTSFDIIAREAKAVFQHGAMVLIDVQLFDEYLEQYKVLS